MNQEDTPTCLASRSGICLPGDNNPLGPDPYNQLPGKQVVAEARGGLSNASQVWQHFPTIDGLGPTGGNAHCSKQSADGTKQQEYAEASSFVPKALLNAVAILKLTQQD